MLTVLLLVLGSLVCAETLPAEPLRLPWFGSVATLSLAALHILVLRLIGRGLSEAMRANPEADWRPALVRFGQFHVLLSVAQAILVMGLLQWPRIVRFHAGLDGWLWIDELLILLPVLAPLPCFWFVMGRLQRPELADKKGGGRDEIWGELLLRGRQLSVLVLFPLMLMVGVHDVVRWYATDPTASQGWQTAVFAAALLLLAVLLPVAIRHMWPAERLPAGPLRQRLERAAQHARLHVRDIYVWKTNRQVDNAAVAGVLPGTRYLFLSDGLLERLGGDEVVAVLLHEAAHVRRGHLAMRLLLVSLPIWWWVSASVLLPTGTALLQERLQQSPLDLIGVAVGLGIYLVVGLGGCGRLLEIDADRWACRNWPRSGASDEKTPAEVAQLLVSALRKLQGDVPSTRSGWMHPSLAQRELSLRQATRSSQCREVRRVHWMFAGLCLLGLLPPIAIAGSLLGIF